MTDTPEEQRRKTKLYRLRYCLERYDRADVEDFRRVFGFTPTKATFAKFGLEAPEWVGEGGAQVEFEEIEL